MRRPGLRPEEEAVAEEAGGLSRTAVGVAAVSFIEIPS
jgi:hypothetical protein